MIQAVWGLFKSPKTLLVIVALGAVGWGLKRANDTLQDYVAVKQTVVEMTQEAEKYAASIETLQRQIAQKDRAILIADRARQRAEEALVQYREIETSIIDNVKEEDDGEIAPVLRDTLDALGRLR